MSFEGPHLAGFLFHKTLLKRNYVIYLYVFGTYWALWLQDGVAAPETLEFAEPRMIIAGSLQINICPLLL